MKTEELKAKGLTDEQIAYVMAENGKDVKREKDKADTYKTQLETAKESLKAFDEQDHYSHSRPCKQGKRI